MGHRRILVAVLVAALSVLALSAWADDTKKGHEGHSEEAMKSVTLEGEILDLYCYMKHPDDGQGTEHAKCANSCIAKGLPIGFMSDGEVLLIIGKGHESAAELVAGFAGAPVRVTGMKITHHGMKAFEIETVEKIDVKG